MFLESDLRRQAPEVLACASRQRSAIECADSLLYAIDALDIVTQNGSGSLPTGEAGTTIPIPPGFQLEAGKSAVSRPSSSGSQLYVAHRTKDGALTLVARIDSEYLWNTADAEGLPGKVAFTLGDPGYGAVLGLPLSDSSEVLTASWALPRSPDLVLPMWRAIVSEPRAEVLAPIQEFARAFPLLLAAALLTPVGLSLWQIRRSLAPLAELGAATRRIAEGDFQTPVRVKSGDELEELAGGFNTMRARLDRQFRALDTAADIDRAILSSMDTATIAQTVLDRIPTVCPCEAVSLTVFASAEPGSDPGAERSGTTWIASRDGARTTVPAPLPPDNLAETEWIVRGGESGGNGPLPEYLAHLEDGRTRGAGVVCCPLREGGELVGLLALRDGPTGRSTDMVPYLRRLADQIAVALANARMIDQVRRLAFCDTLTGLPNRVCYRQHLDRLIRRVREDGDGGGVAVGSLDLDHFARINETLGPGLGDQLLHDAGARLASLAGSAAVILPDRGDLARPLVARVGGDEFAMILPQVATVEEARARAVPLLAAFQQPFRLGVEEVFVTASIGIARYPEDGADGETLQKNADLARSYAKRRGRNTVEQYSAFMGAQGRSRLQLEQALRRALDRGEFALVYQPIIDLASGRPTGAEALVRWEHPEQGRIPPSHFIGLCEESGLIVPLGEWVLRRVCSQIAAWNRSALGRLRLSVNLSGRQLLQWGVVRMVQGILEETGAQPGALTIELTESLLMESGGPTERRLRELAELGVALAIDDFGTGYSSLSYLKNFPVSTLKIDRSFIVDVNHQAGCGGNRGGGDRAGPRDGAGRGRRRSGNPGPGSVPAEARLWQGAGVPVWPPGAGRGIRFVLRGTEERVIRR